MPVQMTSDRSIEDMNFSLKNHCFMFDLDGSGISFEETAMLPRIGGTYPRLVRSDFLTLMIWITSTHHQDEFIVCLCYDGQKVRMSVIPGKQPKLTPKDAFSYLTRSADAER